jgi:hypothetical protein
MMIILMILISYVMPSLAGFVRLVILLAERAGGQQWKSAGLPVLNCLEVVSQPRITPEGKAPADSKAQQSWQVVSIARGR